MEPVIVDMTPDRETPGTIRYKARNGTNSGCEAIYLRRHVFGDGPYPEKIRVEITEIISGGRTSGRVASAKRKTVSR